MSHGDAREGKWRGNWRMQWVASTLHTTSEHVVSSITIADAHTSAASSRLNWRHPPADLNGLGPFRPERRNLVSALVPSHFNWPLPHCRSLWQPKFDGQCCLLDCTESAVDLYYHTTCYIFTGLWSLQAYSAVIDSGVRYIRSVNRVFTGTNNLILGGHHISRRKWKLLLLILLI